MKNKLKFVLLASISTFSLISVAIGTVAWFNNAFTFSGIDGKISGDSAAAYFAYGDGASEETAYGIRTARQLYNLAWLQYNGAFNKDSNKDGVIDKQYYFEIDPDIEEIDMAGYVLPPIGTEENPFVGSFNGNGKIVKSLTVSNKTNLVKPNAIDYDVQPKIVGFFGAVGNPNLVNIGYTYSSDIVSLTNVTLKDITIESKTTQTLVGLAAGYVDGNISGVKIDGNAEIDINDQQHTSLGGRFSNLTDYALVGYTTKKGSSGTYQQKLSKYHHSGGAGGGGSEMGEGGSISFNSYMKWLYSGPRDDGAALDTGDSKNENHITQTNQFEAHYTASDKIANLSENYLFLARYSSTWYFVFYVGDGYFVNGANRYHFTWSINNSGVHPTEYVNYTINFDQQVTINSTKYSTIYLNHQKNTTSSCSIYSTANGNDKTNKIGTTYYTKVFNVIYRLKENQKETSGDIHKSYIPLRFADETHTEVHSDNTGYLTGVSLVSGANNTGLNGSPKIGSYGTNFITNSLGTSTYTGNQIAYQGAGNANYIDSNVEIITYSVSDNDWVAIKDTHNSTYYGEATAPKNSVIGNKINKLRTPEQLKLKKYETYESDKSIVETPTRPLTRTALKNILSKTENGVTTTNYQMSGIHFDASTYNGTTYGKITSADSGKITVPKAYLNGLDSAYSTNYQLLKGAINFKYPNKGYVNFFAGAYNSDPTKKSDFFSLFKVNRDSSNPRIISSIYEIVGVYENSSSDYYAYKVYLIDANGAHTGNAFYVDENNNTITNTNNLTLLFDAEKSLKCNGSTCPAENALYYFEIPINPGDYAMGLVVGSTNSGAYMMYLDIGANAEIKDEVNAYAITTITTGNAFPDGVDFAPVSVTGNGGETIGVFIVSGKQGNITFAVSNENAKISINGTTNLSNYAFQGSKYSTSSPPSGNFIVDGNAPPGGMVIPSSGGTRVLTITLTAANSSSTTNILIIDTLTDDAGTIDESKTVVQVNNVTSSIQAVNTLLANASVNVTNGAENSIRNITNVVTLTRTGNVKNEFVTTYDTTNCNNDTVAVNIVANGTTISIAVSSGSFLIGGEAYADGDTYSES